MGEIKRWIKFLKQKDKKRKWQVTRFWKMDFMSTFFFNIRSNELKKFKIYNIS